MPDLAWRSPTASLETALTLIAGPPVLIELAGLRVLTDPTSDPPGRYEASAITPEKRRGPALPAEALGPIGGVLLSHHQHFDDLDRAGRELLHGLGASTPRTAVLCG